VKGGGEFTEEVREADLAHGEGTPESEPVGGKRGLTEHLHPLKGRQITTLQRKKIAGGAGGIGGSNKNPQEG